MAFKNKTTSNETPRSPEELHRNLPRRPGAVAGLWTHQGDLLREYAAHHSETADLALELPTGTGKTLPGLLLCEWVRQTRSRRVAYACPTKQLASQVAVAAQREGIPFALLTGSARSWNSMAKADYESASSVGIVTYSTIFNSSPKLEAADLLLFDDAHAGEQYVAQAYEITVRRADDSETYLALLDVVADGLSPMAVQSLRSDSASPNMYADTRLVVPLNHPGMVDKLDEVLAGLDGSEWHQYSMIRQSLGSCLVYVAFGSIQVKPLVPPTFENRLFTDARQRLYLSATLGGSAELERSFGRPQIDRLNFPEEASRPRSGRRFFVFPELVPDGGRDLAAEIVARAGKALVLAPDRSTAEASAAEFAQASWPVFNSTDVASGMGPFADAKNGVCGLAARYDGLDLPGDACRLVLLEGTPDQQTLQERFLSSRIRIGPALAERVRTRVVQGVGRCTRGPNDWAVVVVNGDDLTKFLLSPETLDALDPELQAEVQFGIDNCKATSAEEVLENVETFLDQDEVWRTTGEPVLNDYRLASVKSLPDGTTQLGAAARHEIEAFSFAAHDRWQDANRCAQEAARLLGEAGNSLRGYRSLWLYLASSWSRASSSATDDPSPTALMRQAESAAKPSSWILEMAGFPDVAIDTASPCDLAGIATIAGTLDRGSSKAKLEVRFESMLAGLSKTVASKFEPALSELGQLLGAEAWKPKGRGRCDSVWCWQNALWVAIEAKSDQSPSGLVAQKDVRQASDQLRLLSADRGLEQAPIGSATILVSPRPAVDPTGARGAEPHVHLLAPDVVRQIAEDAVSAWRSILTNCSGRDLDQLKSLVATELARHSSLPTQVVERLTVNPVTRLAAVD